MKVCPRCSELYPDAATRCARDGRELKTVNDPLLGRTIGARYRLISRLGAGGMSSVYLARHVLIDRLMAIKILRRDLAQFPIHRDRFLREARAVNRINHENIVEITDFGETEDGLVYLVMEYIAGEPLHLVMRRGPIPLLRAIKITQQVAAALGRAHQMGVIHRDLKPENILLVERRGRSDFVKILDFGIAKIIDAPALTGNQQIFGTPGYIAPEYILGTEIDSRSDLYSLGVVFYEMATGKLPHDYQYPGDLLVKHATEPPILPSQRLATLPRAVDELLLKALAKDPAQRFRDAYALLAALEQLQAVVEGGDEAWQEPADPSLSPLPATAMPIVPPTPPRPSAEPGTGRPGEPRPPLPAQAPSETSPRPAAPAKLADTDDEHDPLVDGRTEIDAAPPVPMIRTPERGNAALVDAIAIASAPPLAHAIPVTLGVALAERASSQPAPALDARQPSVAVGYAPTTTRRGAPFSLDPAGAPAPLPQLEIDIDHGLPSAGADDHAPSDERRSAPEAQRASSPETPLVDPVILARTALEMDAELLDTGRMPPAPAVTLADTVGIVTAWRRRFDAIRDWLDEHEETSSTPVEIAQAMAHATTLLEGLEQRSAEAAGLQVRIDELQERGKDFRTTIGRALDELGRDRSSRSEVLDGLRARQAEIDARRRAHLAKLAAGEGAEEGAADALLWELAALAEEERRVRQDADDLDFQIDSLRTQLDRLNGALEDDLRVIGAQLEAELGRLLEQSRHLRAPLERVAQFVESLA
ncbi:MAG: protein kinase, partial [Deltaproteobacteria bacterium]|nr:protein kinase [Deltaproteobacteria bacterium]